MISNTPLSLGVKIGLGIAFIIGILFLISLWTGIGEGEEKESLLDFTCEELQKSKISSDGAEGRFVTDWGSEHWVDNILVEAAFIEKGCERYNVTGEFDKFDYRAVKK